MTALSLTFVLLWFLWSEITLQLIRFLKNIGWLLYNSLGCFCTSPAFLIHSWKKRQVFSVRLQKIAYKERFFCAQGEKLNNI